jgi:hypothetical protein
MFAVQLKQSTSTYAPCARLNRSDTRAPSHPDTTPPHDPFLERYYHRTSIPRSTIMVVATLWGHIHSIVRNKNYPLASVSPALYRRCQSRTPNKPLFSTGNLIQGSNPLLPTPPRPSKWSTIPIPLLVFPRLGCREPQ